MSPFPFSVLPLRMTTLQYERMVGDCECETRRLLTFLDLPWGERCLAFHRNDRAVQAPSRWQVRQPLYSRSVGRWHRYAPYLDRLAATFEATERKC